MAYSYEAPPDPFAHHHHPYYAPPPAFGFYAPPPQQQPAQVQGSDELRTVFVTGFPADVKERELNNMLRFLPGYEASQMHFRNGQAQGFALFVTGALACAAVDAIQNLLFDNEAVLRAEMAHKNMYLKDDPAAATKRSRGSSYEGASYEGYPPAAAPALPAPPQGAAAFGGPGGGHPGGYGGAPTGLVLAAPPPASAAGVPPMQPRGYAPISNTKDNPPCNTLFIGNLGDSVNETEMRGLFSHQPGFQQLKLVRGPKGVSCFIEFGDVPTAMAVHDAQQGAILATSDRGGIRIQYSKNPFGRKRDAAGAFVDVAPAAGGGGVGGGHPQPAADAAGAAGYGGAPPAAAAPPPAAG